MAFNFIIHCLGSMTFATHKANRSRSNGFLPDVFHIWDEVIWLTPEKGRLISTALIWWEQTRPSPKVSQQFNYSDWKQLGFLLQEICNIIIPVFSNCSSVLPLCGQALIGTGYLSHAGLLQTGLIGYVALTNEHGFPLVG